MDPITVAMFGQVKNYLKAAKAPGGIEMNEQIKLIVDILCEHHYNEVINCLDEVYNQLSLDQYYAVKNTFRGIEAYDYQFNYDFFKIY